MGPPVNEQQPVRLSVRFNAPENTVIELQGPALAAYREWVETQSTEDEQYLADMIMEQCEDHVAMWTTLDEWDFAQ